MKYFTIIATALLLASQGVMAAPLTATAKEAFVLLNNTATYKDKGMGNLEFLEYLTVGDKVTLLSDVVKMKADGKEREYYKVKLVSGKEAFVRTILLGVGGTLGVVKAESAFVYSEPRDIKITDRTLGKGQMVVVLKDVVVDPFIHVIGYDGPKDVSIDCFVSREDVSVNDIDANAVIMLTVAKAQKNEAIRKNLLTVANTKYSTSLFIDQIRALLAPLSPRASKPAAGTALLIDDKVNVRDLPNEKGSKVVATLAKGASVELTEVTTENYTIEGTTAPWYKIKEPSGWIFGSFLSVP